MKRLPNPRPECEAAFNLKETLRAIAFGCSNPIEAKVLMVMAHLTRRKDGILIVTRSHIEGFAGCIVKPEILTEFLNAGLDYGRWSFLERLGPPEMNAYRWDISEITNASGCAKESFDRHAKAFTHATRDLARHWNTEHEENEGRAASPSLKELGEYKGTPR